MSFFMHLYVIYFLLAITLKNELQKLARIVEVKKFMTFQYISKKQIDDRDI